MAKVGITGADNIKKHYVDICNIVDGDISAEVISVDFDGMVAEAKELSALHPNIVVKIPMIKEGIKAIKWCTDNGIRTNCTLVCLLYTSPSQRDRTRYRMPPYA